MRRYLSVTIRPRAYWEDGAFVGRRNEVGISAVSEERPGYQCKSRDRPGAEYVPRKRTAQAVYHPAGQYYEWDAQKNKVTFSGQDQPVLYMAGFFDRFQDGDHFVILTTAANASVSPVHDRMPLILGKEEVEAWIYDDAFLEFALHKVPAKLQKSQEYEQQTLF